MTNKIRWEKIRQRFIPIVYDFCMIFFAWLIAYWLRFDLRSVPNVDISEAFILLPYVLIIQAISFWYFGLYRGVWRFASIPDLTRIIKAVLFGTVLILLTFFFLAHGYKMPRTVPIFYAFLLIFFLGVGRFGVRWLRDYRRRDKHSGKRTLIIGAGSAGEGLIRDLFRHIHHEYVPIAVVDDDEKKGGQEIHGVRVVGTCADINDIVKKNNIELILIALPSANSAQMRMAVDKCIEAKIPFQTLPNLRDIAGGFVKTEALRPVSLEDLLGRDTVEFEDTLFSESLKGNVVLVTGGGGSIGSELCRQIARLQPSSLIIIDHSEYNIYSICLELNNLFPKLTVTPCLVSINDAQAIKRIFALYKPNIIFHAAAYKHVPVLENQIEVAVKNNFIGTQIVAKAADQIGAEKFILISTDKAVNPTNVMGASKRATEIFCQLYNEKSKTRYITVRFGNVLGSSGSVVPLFKKQLADGGPITVTHPDITRFFMTIPEAVRLILQASNLGHDGEIFVLDMGEQIKIQYLAEQLIRLSGKELGQDIEITHVGLRPGEKMYEELFYETEEHIPTELEKIFQAKSSVASGFDFDRLFQDLEKAVDNSSIADISSILRTMVPEWK
jgi:FlaA1/EpsC-like NDP-sugar epimerase